MGVLTKIICGILALHLYGMSAYVSEVDHAENMVCFTDYATEHEWWTEGNADEFVIWQDVVLIMNDSGTSDRYDDVIVKVTPEYFGAMNYVTKGGKGK